MLDLTYIETYTYICISTDCYIHIQRVTAKQRRAWLISRRVTVWKIKVLLAISKISNYFEVHTAHSFVRTMLASLVSLVGSASAL
jgi:hypothetical protein